MDTNYDSSDRKPADFVLFALAFLGFVIGAGGVVIASPPAAFTGFALMLVCIVAYLFGPSPGE
jgi:hypothetical protein